MSKGPFVIFGVFAAICVIVIPYFALAKEGGEEAGPVKVESWDEGGKELFVNNCGPCHTLAAAGTDGVVGPNLDDLLAPGGNATFEGSAQRAMSAVICGAGNGRMPAGILQGENAQEVAAFVGAYAGQVGEGAEAIADTRSANLKPPETCGAPAETSAPAE
jgi:mono/diheme cytochrome c family protein